MFKILTPEERKEFIDVVMQWCCKNDFLPPDIIQILSELLLSILKSCDRETSLGFVNAMKNILEKYYD